MEEISEPDRPLRQILGTKRQIDSQITRLRTFYRRAIADLQQLNHETADVTADLKFQKM
jgi:hypothetical protein